MKEFFEKVKWNRVIYGFMGFLIILFLVFIGKSNILPFKYFIVLSSVFVLWLVILFFLLVFKVTKGNNIKRKIAGYSLSVILIILMGVIVYYLNSTLSFFANFGTNTYKEENYLVVVLKESQHTKLVDLENKEIGYVKNELGKINDAISKLNEELAYQEKEYEEYNLMINDLIDKKLESLLLEESHLAILEENGYDDLFKIIHRIVVRTEIIEVNKEVDVTNSPFSIYISGIDSYGSIKGVSRSDVNMVVTINPNTKQILLVSTPRDYYVQLRGTTGYKDKLTHAGIYGIETSIGTMEDLLDTEINYYFRTNFTTLETVVNALGGVDVYSEYTFTSSWESGGTYRFTKGYNHLNGRQALAFARERKNVPGGDRTRGINQQAVMDGLVRKATSSAILTKYNKLLNELKNTFQTNMTEKEILKLIRMQLNDMASWNITSYSLDGTDASDYTYSYQAAPLYVMKPKEETVTHAIDLINKVIAGEILDSSYGEVGDIKNPTEVIVPMPEPVLPEEPVIPEEDPSLENPDEGENEEDENLDSEGNQNEGENTGDGDNQDENENNNENPPTDTPEEPTEPNQPEEDEELPPPSFEQNEPVSPTPEDDLENNTETQENTN